MNYQEKEVFKLKKQLNSKEEQYNRQRNMLRQKIELLTCEISEYQEKQMKSRQLNESIIMGYRQNESFREQFNQKQIQTITSQHQEQLRRVRLKHKEQKKQLDEQIHNLKCQNEMLRTHIDRQQLENEKKMADLKHEWEEKLTTCEKDLGELFADKLNVMTDKLRQTEDMCRLYRDQLEMGLGNTLKSSYHQHNQLKTTESDECANNKALQEVISRRKPLAARQQESSSLALRINRVLSQVNPNQLRLEQKIRDITRKRL